MEYAVLNDNIEAILLFLKHSADIFTVDRHGDTPLDIARRFSKVQIVELLERYIEERRLAIMMITHKRLGNKALGWSVGDEIWRDISSHEEMLAKNLAMKLSLRKKEESTSNDADDDST